MRLKIKQTSKAEPYEADWTDEMLEENFTDEQIAALRRGEPIWVPCGYVEGRGAWVTPCE